MTTRLGWLNDLKISAHLFVRERGHRQLLSGSIWWSGCSALGLHTSCVHELHQGHWWDPHSCLQPVHRNADYHSVVLHLYSLWHVYEHIFRSSKGLPIAIWFIIPVLASERTLASSLQTAIELPSSVYCLPHAKCYAPIASPCHETIPVQKWNKYPV